MKKSVCLILAVVLLASFTTGCKKSNDRILYKDANFDELVELGEYKGLEVDTSSDTINEYYQEVLENDVTDNEFFSYKEITEGKLENGDIANIDYTGKKDGVAFEGGTATAQDLEIGSGSFIEGFEEGLIGVEIGKTVDLNLTFPKDYHASDLAGADVVFTVKVNSAQKKITQKPEQYFSKLGFESVSKYREDAKRRAIENYLIQTVASNCKVKEYPEAEIDIIYDSTKKAMESNLSQQYNMTFDAYLEAIGQTEAEFKSAITKDQIKPSMEIQIILYAIMDKENIEFTKEEIEKAIDNVVKEVNNSSVTAETVKEFYGEYYFEEMVITEKVIDFVYENAKLK